MNKPLACATVLAVALAVAVPFLAGAAGETGNVITYSTGKCFGAAGADGPWNAVKTGDPVADNSYLKTEAESKLEVTLPDGSVIRLGDNTVFMLESQKKAKETGMSFSVILGKAWAKVRKVTTGNTFEVKTKTAVAGVRGTVFSVMAQKDASTVVKVFEGLVAVNNKPALDSIEAAEKAQAAKKGERVQVSGPKEISKRAWEEMIAKAMRMVMVAANGEITEPLAFDLEVEKKDDWVVWNMARDAALKSQ